MFIRMDNKAIKSAHSTSEGYNVQDERCTWSTAKKAYQALQTLRKQTGLKLHIRCGFWGSGHVETSEGYVLHPSVLSPFLLTHLEFVGPNDE